MAKKCVVAQQSEKIVKCVMAHQNFCRLRREEAEILEAALMRAKGNSYTLFLGQQYLKNEHFSNLGML